MRWAYSLGEMGASCGPRQVPEILRAAGCELIELLVGDAPAEGPDAGGELACLAAAREEASNLAHPREPERRQALAHAIRLVETAARLGAPAVRLVPAQVGPPLGAKPLGGRPGGPATCRYEDAELWAFDGLLEIAATAERCGVQIAVTGAAGGFGLSPTEHRRFIDRINSAWVGACVDLARVAAVGDPIDWQQTLGARTLVTVVDTACVRPQALHPRADDAVVVLTGAAEAAAAFITAVEAERTDG